MDLISKPGIELTTLALDGLSARHKVISSNIANAETPGFKRSDVSFEDQLNKIMVSNEARQKEKEDYSMGLMYNPNSLSSAGQINRTSNFLDNNNFTESNYQDFQPEITETNDANTKPNGNNINIEYEMAQLAQNGMKYTALSTIQGKMFQGLQDVIRGGGM